MSIKIWRFIALLLTALTMGMHLAHVLELPPKLQWDAELYRTVQTSLYPLFGSIGPFLDIGAIIALFVLAYLVRSRTTIAAAVIMLLGLIVWGLVVGPAAMQINGWETIPVDWANWRSQWQYGQAVNFVLDIIAFSLLTISILMETPPQNRNR